MKERRHFTRILFSTQVQLFSKDLVWTASLIDLSFKGALITKPDNWLAGQATELKMTFQLPQSDITIVMDTQVVHEEAEQLGLKCLQIDIESVTHLKRLIELNLGNDSLLHREFEHLAHPE